MSTPGGDASASTSLRWSGGGSRPLAFSASRTLRASPRLLLFARLHTDGMTKGMPCDHPQEPVSRWRLVTDTASDTSRALRPHSSPLMSCDVLLMSSRKPRPRRGRRVAPEAPPDLAARFDRVRSDSTKCDLGVAVCTPFSDSPTYILVGQVSGQGQWARFFPPRPRRCGAVHVHSSSAAIWRRWRRPLLEL